MRKFLFRFSFSLAVALGVVEGAHSQPTTAMDFTMTDCATGQLHNLYSVLDSGNAVIMEFFMINCQPCIDAGKALDSMYKKLKLGCPNVRFFQTSFNNSDKCGAIVNWHDSLGFSSVPFDSGAAQISYYGFFGMPTVAVAAGSSHKLVYLLTTGGFNTGDTATIADSIRNFCSMSAIQRAENNFSFSVYPNPFAENFTLSFNAKESGTLKIELENILGTKYETLADGKIPAGEWKGEFPSENLPKGIYYLRIHLDDTVLAEKIIIQ